MGTPLNGNCTLVQNVQCTVHLYSLYLVEHQLQPKIWDKQTDKQTNKQTDRGRYRVAPQLKTYICEKNGIEGINIQISNVF